MTAPLTTETVDMSERNSPNDEVLYVRCPKCGRSHEDHDGFGVLFCEHCGFCQHASITEGTCDLCGAFDDPQDRCPTRERA